MAKRKDNSNDIWTVFHTSSTLNENLCQDEIGEGLIPSETTVIEEGAFEDCSELTRLGIR